MENRIFPAMLANKCAMFNFQDCRFHVRKRKETSGRVVSVSCSGPDAVNKPGCVGAAARVQPLSHSPIPFEHLFALMSSSALWLQRQHSREGLPIYGPLVRCAGGVEAIH